MVAQLKVGFDPAGSKHAVLRNVYAPSLLYTSISKERMASRRPLFTSLSETPEQTREGLQKWDAAGDNSKLAARGPHPLFWFSKFDARNLSVYDVRLPFS